MKKILGSLLLPLFLSAGCMNRERDWIRQGVYYPSQESFEDNRSAIDQPKHVTMHFSMGPSTGAGDLERPENVRNLVYVDLEVRHQNTVIKRYRFDTTLDEITPLLESSTPMEVGETQFQFGLHSADSLVIHRRVQSPDFQVTKRVVKQPTIYAGVDGGITPEPDTVETRNQIQPVYYKLQIVRGGHAKETYFIEDDALAVPSQIESRAAAVPQKAHTRWGLPNNDK